jgi:hypothetical protein
MISQCPLRKYIITSTCSLTAEALFSCPALHALSSFFPLLSHYRLMKAIIRTTNYIQHRSPFITLLIPAYVSFLFRLLALHRYEECVRTILCSGTSRNSLYASLETWTVFTSMNRTLRCYKKRHWQKLPLSWTSVKKREFYSCCYISL